MTARNPARINSWTPRLAAVETALSLAPIDLRLVETKLLDAREVAWLNAYHKRVRNTLSPLVDAPTRRWLAEATRALEAH